MPRIFISYRRKDNPYAVPTISRELKKHFGNDSVFLDVEDIPPAVHFRKYIADSIKQCDVLLVIIGDKWLGEKNDKGESRLHDANDTVRLEIELALNAGIPIIPVLIENASMPLPSELPAIFEDFSYTQNCAVRGGADMESHIAGLISDIKEVCKPKPAENPVDGSKNLQALPKTVERSKVLKEIENALNEYTGNSMFAGDAIPHEKLFNAINAYAPDIAQEDALLLYDATFTGNARDGMILTADSLYWRINSWTAPRKYLYSDIQDITWERIRLVSSRLTANDKQMVYKWWDFPDYNVALLKNIIVRVASLYHSG